MWHFNFLGTKISKLVFPDKPCSIYIPICKRYHRTTLHYSENCIRDALTNTGRSTSIFKNHKNLHWLVG